MYTQDQIGPFIENKANAMELIEWLQQGAPHTVFNIDYASISSENDSGTFFEALNDLWESDLIDFDPEDGAGDCGTVCCIAGAASQMKLNEFGARLPVTNDLEWEVIQQNAFDFLGMDPEDADEGGAIWGIFDPDNWDGAPSGPEAARALVEYSITGDWQEAINVAEGMNC